MKFCTIIQHTWLHELLPNIFTLEQIDAAAERERVQLMMKSDNIIDRIKAKKAMQSQFIKNDSLDNNTNTNSNNNNKYNSHSKSNNVQFAIQQQNHNNKTTSNKSKINRKNPRLNNNRQPND
jgi:hypothetical protein